jgi:uncharacterized membrane protein
MKNIVLALVCAIAAVLVRYLPTAGIAVSWRVDQHTHRGVSFNIVASWILLIVALILVLIYAVRRVQAS